MHNEEQNHNGLLMLMMMLMRPGIPYFPLPRVALVKGPCARYVTTEPCQLPMFYFAMQIPDVSVYRLFVENSISVAVE